MKEEDIPEVSRLLCSCYKWLGDKEGFSPQLVQFLVNQRGSIDTVGRESETEMYFVACEDAEIAGMVSVKNNEITKLYVDPRRHRRGIGRLLFEKAEELIENNGYSTIILGVLGKSPVAFYEAMGMKVSGRRSRGMQEESNREVILMKKSCG